MKLVHAIYFSPTDGTKNICRKIAEGTKLKIVDHDITRPENRRLVKNFTKDDLCIIGAPVYSGRIPKLVAEYIKKLHGHKTKVVIAVTYGNRKYEDALVEMEDLVKAYGFELVAAGAFVAEHAIESRVAQGRPDQNDLVSAEEFGKACIMKVQKISESRWLPLKIKGNRPYRDVIRKNHDLVPKTNEQCNQCGICYKHCPTGAIHKDRVDIISSDLCIRCFSCVRRCPKHAKVFDQDVVKNVQTWLVENCVDIRKEPEIFI